MQSIVSILTVYLSKIMPLGSKVITFQKPHSEFCLVAIGINRNPETHLLNPKKRFKVTSPSSAFFKK